jgi:hypothetical protein
MSKTRNNHYVPQWYQEGFFEAGKKTLAYLNMSPPQRVLADGRVITERGLFDAPTSRAFCQLDLYSTFFGTSVNDEIERYLFGNIDAKGANAIRAFAGSDVGEWHRHFQTLFQYVDIQKIRTPKGLDWLRAQYPTLNQNDLMAEMQGIRMLHCKIWVEGVREIVSAEDADVKFLVSDHPVTIYNHAAAPDGLECAYPNDPSIALKASQTIFPLSRDFCLILTNLEYARDPSTKPLEKRTFARNYRQSMVRTDAFIRKRKLTSQEVNRINYVIKRRARRYIAAGRKEWLTPELNVTEPWSELRTTLLPPKDGLWHFGGKMYAKFEDGRFYYQDEFGRTETERDFLKKAPPAEPLKPGSYCGCGYGRPFQACCMSKPAQLRPAWNERSIRERNIMFQNAIVNVLGLDKEDDWTMVRRNLTDEKISKVYHLYEGLWPLETDLLALLPKPDGDLRAIYTGSIHPTTITDFALGSPLYFREVMIEHPFVHAGMLADKYNPVKNPRAYRGEFLKAVVFFFTVMPLVELGLVNLIPDPCSFDAHLRDQMHHMAQSRSAGIRIDQRKEPRIERLMREDTQRSIMSLPRDVLRSQMSRAIPSLDPVRQEETLNYMEQLREHDPLAILQQDSLAGGKEGGQLSMIKLAPNFEIAMYLAQATGASIITDSPFRWEEIRRAITQRIGGPAFVLGDLARAVERAPFAFPQNAADTAALAFDGGAAAHQNLMRDVFKYLSKLGIRGPKPNWESQLAGRFARAHAPLQAAVRKLHTPAKAARVSGFFPLSGIQDNTVNRLLLMSSSENHLASVPMAFFFRE